ncbi:serine hydrolase [Streptomyces sp. NPDC005907]|uniref:serine hydrolase n=1 Tax=Streptomyces sp. NPDC005907 TaxID=3154571 RepID=UPI0033FEEB0B
MAGESPDRSKQHESSASSAEATSGTPAAVPGPTRGSASTPADPRMAVARERAATVRVDQATAVFSTRALKEAEGSPEAAGKPEAGAAPSESAGKGAPGDARLRAAVAAWVATADDPEDAAPDPDAASSPGEDSSVEDTPGTGASGEDTTGTPVKGAPGESVPGEGTTAEGGSDASTPGTAVPGKDSSGTGASRKGAVGSAASGETAVPAPGEGASRERGSDVSTPAADAPGKGIPGTAAKGATPEDAEPSAEARAAAPEDAEPAQAVKAAVDAKAPEDAKPSADATPEDAGPAPAAKPPVGAKAPQDADPSADAEASVDAKAPADAKGAAEPEDAGRPVDQPTAVFKAVPPAAPPVDQPTTMLKLGDAGKTPADKTHVRRTAAPGAKPPVAPGAGPATKPGAEPEAASGAKPTAAPGAKPAGTPGAEPGNDTPRAKPEPNRAGDGDESPAERTSKFVALKPLDEPPAKPRATTPATAKPPVPPAEATAAVPQVGPERTTQQPLPPKPPLDLLAELTNTPPPPETPVRTLVRRFKIWTPLVLLLAVVFAVAQAVRPLPEPGLALTAGETYTFDGGDLDLPWPGQGQSAIEVEGVGSLGTDGKQKPAPIASVAKIMTAYVILEEHPLKGNEGGEKITVDQRAEDESKNEDESTAALSKGQKFTERQMLQMLMIPSGNNAARLLARWDSDGETFVGKMNAAAKKLGMSKTTYTDPSGLEKTTVSTATDQLKLAKAVMQKDVFRSIVGMARADVPGLDKPIYNNNDLLVKQVGVIGLKTGSSTPAGGNLVWAATKTVAGKTQTVYGAVLGQNAGTGRVWDSLQLALTNSQKLIDKVQQGLTTATVVKKGDVVGYVDDRLGGKTPVVATENLKAVGWPGLRTKLSIGPGDKTVPHSAKAGTVVGELTVGDGSDHAVDIPVALRSDLGEPGLGAKLTRVS